MPILTKPQAEIQAEQLGGSSSWLDAQSASFDETLATGPTAAMGTFRELQRSEGLTPLEALFDRFGLEARKLSPMLTAKEAKQRVDEAGLSGEIPLVKYPNGLRRDTLDILIDLNKKKVRRQSISQQYDGWSPGVVGMVTGSLVDPTNVVVSFMPVVGEARYAALLSRAGSGIVSRAGVRAGVGALEGLAGAAAVEPLIYAGQQQWRNDYDAYDSMLNIAGGAAFGSLLHAGAGLGRDAFGNPIAESVTVQRMPFADPDVIASQAFRAKARAQGVGEGAIQALTPKAARDDVTGFFDGRQANIKTDTVSRALKHVNATQEPSYFVSADITNLGGLNAHVGNVAEAANVHYRAMATILDNELRATGGDVVSLRTGGDELGVVVVNADSNAVAQALDRVDQRIADYAQTQGLADIPHPKRSNEKGVGLHTGVAPIESGASVPDILRQADLGVDASKRGIDRVRRIAEPADRAGQGAGDGSGRVRAEGTGSVRAEGAGVADPFGHIRPFIEGLDQSSQAAALRMAVAQAANGQRLDVTPAMLADPSFKANPDAYAAAVSNAKANALELEGADPVAAAQAQRKVASAPNQTLEGARKMLADDEERFRERGGDPANLEVDDGDAQLQVKAAKAVSLCMMRHGG